MFFFVINMIESFSISVEMADFKDPLDSNTMQAKVL